jgi:hypothetical protein
MQKQMLQEAIDLNINNKIQTGGISGKCCVPLLNGEINSTAYLRNYKCKIYSNQYKI